MDSRYQNLKFLKACVFESPDSEDTRFTSPGFQKPGFLESPAFQKPDALERPSLQTPEFSKIEYQTVRFSEIRFFQNPGFGQFSMQNSHFQHLEFSKNR